MTTKYLFLVILVVVATCYFVTGCYYDTTVIPDAPEITGEVTFSKDIIPIFNSSCNVSGCHSPGGKSPDLSSISAYNSLINGNYINTGVPAESELYLWMAGKKSTPMPVSGINASYNATILAWIKQGALNN